MASIFIELEVKDDGTPVVRKFSGEVEKNFKKAAAAHKTFAQKAGASLTSVRSKMKSFASGLLSMKTAVIGTFAVLGGRAVIGVMKSLTEAFGVQEQAVNALNAALKNQGTFSRETSKDLQDYAAGLQKVTTFGDEAIIRGQGLLTTFGLQGDKLKEATRLALDFATATDRDVTTAFNLLGKAAAGNTAELSRYGIVLDKNIPQSGKFAAVLQQMEERFGGAAQEKAKTFTGRLTQMGNKLGDLKEKMGGFISAGLATLAEALDPIVDRLSDWFVANKDLITQDVTAFFSGLAKVAKGTLLVMRGIAEAGGVLMKTFRALVDTPEKAQARLINKASAEGASALFDLFDRGAERVGRLETAIASINSQGGFALRGLSVAGNALKEAREELTRLHTAIVLQEGTFEPAIDKALIGIADAARKSGQAVAKGAQESAEKQKKIAADLMKERIENARLAGEASVRTFELENTLAEEEFRDSLIRDQDAAREKKRIAEDLADDRKRLARGASKSEFDRARESIDKQRAALRGMGASFATLWSGVKLGAKEAYLNMVNFGLQAAQTTVATFGAVSAGLQEGFFDFLTGNFQGIGDAFASLGKKILNLWLGLIANMVTAWIASGLAGLFNFDIGGLGGGGRGGGGAGGFFTSAAGGAAGSAARAKIISLFGGGGGATAAGAAQFSGSVQPALLAASGGGAAQFTGSVQPALVAASGGAKIGATGATAGFGSGASAAVIVATVPFIARSIIGALQPSEEINDATRVNFERFAKVEAPLLDLFRKKTGGGDVSESEFSDQLLFEISRFSPGTSGARRRDSALSFLNAQIGDRRFTAGELPPAELFAARGFDGMVTRPTTFHVAERGPEHVKVSPGRGGDAGGVTIRMDLRGAVIASKRDAAKLLTPAIEAGVRRLKRRRHGA